MLDFFFPLSETLKIIYMYIYRLDSPSGKDFSFASEKSRVGPALTGGFQS